MYENVQGLTKNQLAWLKRTRKSKDPDVRKARRALLLDGWREGRRVKTQAWKKQVGYRFKR